MIVYFPGVHERLPHNVLTRKEREKKILPRDLFPKLSISHAYRAAVSYSQLCIHCIPI